MSDLSVCMGCGDDGTRYDPEWGGYLCTVCKVVPPDNLEKPAGLCEGCAQPFSRERPLVYSPGWSIPYHGECLSGAGLTT